MNRKSIAIEAGVAALCLIAAAGVLWYYLGHRFGGEASTQVSPAPATPPVSPLVSSTIPGTSIPAAPSADCPAWVNCMPGPDVSKTCVVPPGCENFTQKAY